MKYFTSILFLCLTSIIQAQNYQEMVWESLAELNQLQKPTLNNKYHFIYKVRVVPHGKQVQAITTTVETIVASDRIIIKSPQGDYYQDEKNAFTIIKDEKKIIWTNSPSSKWQNQDFSGVINMKKTFFETSTYSRVQRAGEPSNRMLIKVLPALEVRKEGTIEFLLIEIDIDNNRIVRMLTSYNQLAPQKIREYIYEKSDLKSSIAIAKNVKDYIIKNNKLKTAYTEYELIDLRKNPNGVKK